MEGEAETASPSDERERAGCLRGKGKQELVRRQLTGRSPQEAAILWKTKSKTFGSRQNSEVVIYDLFQLLVCRLAA